MLSRRKLLTRGTAAFAGGLTLLIRLGGKATAAETTPAPLDTPPPANPARRPYTPVTTPNGSTLPFVLKDGVKEFHLVAEPVKREFAPGMTVNCWGYNGQTPGPTIEAVEGDRVRILVTNRLPEPTSVHWHGVITPLRHGRRGRRDPAGHPAGRDVRLRISAGPAWHPDVPPAR